MSSKIRLLVFASVAIASINVSFSPSGALAAERNWGTAVAVHPRHRVHVYGHRPYFAARRSPLYDYGGPPDANPHSVLSGPGYVFVPGRGILGEGCNLPTSACPNSVRDIQ